MLHILSELVCFCYPVWGLPNLQSWWLFILFTLIIFLFLLLSLSAPWVFICVSALMSSSVRGFLHKQAYVVICKPFFVRKLHKTTQTCTSSLATVLTIKTDTCINIAAAAAEEPPFHVISYSFLTAKAPQQWLALYPGTETWTQWVSKQRNVWWNDQWFLHTVALYHVCQIDKER